LFWGNQLLPSRRRLWQKGSMDLDLDPSSAYRLRVPATNTNENDEVVVNIHLDLGSFVFVVTFDLGANEIFGGIRAQQKCHRRHGVEHE